MSSRQPAKRGVSPLLWVGLGAVAVLAAVLAMVLGGDDPKKSATTTVNSGGSVVQLQQNQPVTVAGEALEKFGGDPSSDLAIGKPAPTLTGKNFDGTPVVVDPKKGPVMVVFLAHWCPHCNSEAPVLREWFNSGAVPKNLQVIGVSTGVDPSAPNYPPSQWVADVSWPWQMMADSEAADAARAYGLPGYPYFVIVGADGTVKQRNSGELPIADLVVMVNRAINA